MQLDILIGIYIVISDEDGYYLLQYLIQFFFCANSVNKIDKQINQDAAKHITITRHLNQLTFVFSLKLILMFD